MASCLISSVASASAAATLGKKELEDRLHVEEQGLEITLLTLSVGQTNHNHKIQEGKKPSHDH